MAHVNIIRQTKTDGGWRNVALERNRKGRIKWGAGLGRYLIEWREHGEPPLVPALIKEGIAGWSAHSGSRRSRGGLSLP